MPPKSPLRALAAALALAVAPQAIAAPQPGACLRYDELDQIHMTTDTTAVAVNTRKIAYMVTFRTSCQARASGAFFILRRDRLGECLDAGDLFEVSTPAPPCTVQSIAPLQSIPVQGGR
jgi:hypothetical protein